MRSRLFHTIVSFFFVLSAYAGTPERDGFVFWTDTHLKSNGLNAPVLMNPILSASSHPKVFFGGDCMPSRAKDIETWYNLQKSLIDQINPEAKVFCLRGNHDFYYRDSDDRTKGRTLSREETSALLEEEMRGGYVKNPDDRGGCYFYYDEPSARIRYVVFDTDDMSIGCDKPMQTFEGVGEQQLDWMVREAIGGAPEDYSFVFLMHVPVAFPYNPKHSKLIQEVDKVARTGRLLAVFSGHIHHDFQIFRQGVFWISTASDAYYRDVNRTPYTVRDGSHRKGTPNEQAFDYVSIGKDIISCRRTGYGSDRIYHLRRSEVRAGRRLKLKSALGPDARWIIYDASTPQFVRGENYSGHWELSNEFATISEEEGIVSAISRGEAVAVAIAADTSRIEIFPVYVK